MGFGFGAPAFFLSIPDMLRIGEIFTKPSKELTTTFLQWFAVVLSSFILIYYTTNSYAASCQERYHMYASWELQIPLVPQMIIIYLGYVGIFGVVPFVFKTPNAIKALALSMLTMLLTSGLIFVLFPGNLGYTRQANSTEYGFLFSLLYAIDKPHNLFPSLHVSFAFLCALGMIHQTKQKWFHVFMKIWFALVCLSVVLVHQHHLFDIALGMLLSWVVHRKVYLGTISPQGRSGNPAVV